MKKKSILTKLFAILLTVILVCQTTEPAVARQAADSADVTDVSAMQVDASSESAATSVQTGGSELEELSFTVIETSDSLPSVMTTETTAPTTPTTATVGDDAWNEALESIWEGVASYLTDEKASTSVEIDVSSYNIAIEDAKSLVSEAREKDYHSFYVSDNYGYSYATETTIGVVVLIFTLDQEVAIEKTAELEDEIDYIVNSVDPSWCDLEKVLYLNDYLARNCEYDLTLENHSVYNALIDKCAVCEGYTGAMYTLLTKLGIESELVTSEVYEHTWNYVKIGENYYHLDVTWDDPTVDRFGFATHEYFLKSSSYFMNEGGHDFYVVYTDGETGEETIALDWTFTGGVTADDAQSEQYDDAELPDGPFEYIDGYWYTVYDNGTIYDVEILKYSIEGETITLVGTELNFSDTYKTRYVGRYNGHYYADCDCLASWNGSLYYTALDQVYCYTPSDGTNELIYTLSEDEVGTDDFWILGILINRKGEVQVRLSYFVDSVTRSDGAIITIDILPGTATLESIASTDSNISTETITAFAGSRVYDSVELAVKGTLLEAREFILDSTAADADKALLLLDMSGMLTLIDTSTVTDGTVTFTVEVYTDTAEGVVVYGYNGDVNGDGSITAIDVLKGLKGISGSATLNEVEKAFADVDSDGDVTTSDLLATLKYVSGQTSSVN